MTLVVLFSILLELLVIGYFISNRRIFSPFVMTCAGYIISILVLLINANNWNYNMSFLTFFTILTSILAVGVGEAIAGLNDKKVHNNSFYTNSDIFPSTTSKKISIKLYKTVIIILIMTAFVFYYYFDIRNVASIIGYGNFSDMISAYNKAQKLGNELSTLSTIGYSASSVISNIYTYVNLHALINKTKKFSLIEAAPLLIFVLINVISSNRIGFIYIIITCVLMGYIIWMDKYQWKRNIDSKIVKYSVTLLVVFIGIFSWLGSLTGKTQHFNSPFESFSLYTSGSIVALDKFLNEFRYSFSNFGNETLYGLNRIMSVMGFETIISKRNLPQVDISPNLMSNVYTSLRRYINDYNYLGMYLIQIMIGFVYTKILKKIEMHVFNREILVVIMFSSFYYPIILQFIDELVITTFISQTMIFQVLLYFLLYSILFTNQKR